MKITSIQATDAKKMERYTIKDFRKQFPDDDACLEWLKQYLFPQGILCKTCQRVTKHHKVVSRKSYSCNRCGHHVHPTAGTIYHKSTTPLTDWFYAVYLMASTRCGISAKQLERELGVTYKTAWRMFKMIRTMLDESDNKIGGIAEQVEIDETYIGGQSKMNKKFKNKTTVVGALERKCSVIAKVVPNRKSVTLMPFIEDAVQPYSTIYTDEHGGYNPVPISANRYEHQCVNHSAKVWVIGDAHTNSIEGFWSLLKGGIRGVYKHVKPSNLQSYVNEYAFRYNRRHDQTPMFLSFLGQVKKSSC